MKLNYIIIILIVFILIVLFKYNSSNPSQPNLVDYNKNNSDNSDNLYNSRIEILKRQATIEAEAEAENEVNHHANHMISQIKLENKKPQSKKKKYVLDFHFSPESPDTHSFLPVWNLVQEEAPPDLECNDINCSSKKKNPALLLTIDQEDEYNIPLTQDYKKLKENLSLFDIHLDSKNVNLSKDVVENFQSKEDLEKKIHNLCHHDTFFTRHRDPKNPGGYVYCIKNNKYVKGCSSVNSHLGLDNFSNAYNMFGSYIDTIPDKRKEIHQICSSKYKQNLKDLGLCSPTKLNEFAGFNRSIAQNTHRNRLSDGHNYQHNKKYSDIIKYACQYNS